MCFLTTAPLTLRESVQSLLHIRRDLHLMQISHHWVIRLLPNEDADEFKAAVSH